MADPTPQAESTQQLLAEAIRQIRRLCDLMEGGAPLPPAPVTAGFGAPVGLGAAGGAALADVTNYTFRAPPSVGSRVTIRRVADLGTGEQLRAGCQGYAHTLADLLGAQDLVVSQTDALPNGAEYAVVYGRLPAEPGGAAVLRSGFVRLPSGLVNVEFVARANDPEAEPQFGEILRTLRPAVPTDPLGAALQGVTAPGSARSAGVVAFDLPPAFRNPAVATFASPDQRVRIEVALAEGGVGGSAAPPPPKSWGSFVGGMASAIGDDGRSVLYEMPPANGPAPAGLSATSGAAFGAAPPPTAGEVVREVEVNGRRIRITVVADDAQALVRDLLARVGCEPN